MLTHERHERILRRLALDGRVYSAPMAQELEVSLDTVRRDIATLDELGRLTRVRGGAMPPSTPVPPSHAARAERRTAEKAAIAERAAALLDGVRVALLGGGTTMVELAKRWPEGARTVVTPSIDVAGALAGRAGVEVVLLGGRVLADPRGAVGPDTVAAVRAIRADACIVGTCSLHPATGVTVYEREESFVIGAMVEASRAMLVLADADKLGTTGPFVVAGPDRIDTLITDRSAPEDVVRDLRAADARVELV